MGTLTKINCLLKAESTQGLVAFAGRFLGSCALVLLVKIALAPSLSFAQTTGVQGGLDYLDQQAILSPNGALGLGEGVRHGPLNTTATVARMLQQLNLSNTTLSQAVAYLTDQNPTTVETLSMRSEVLSAAGQDISAEAALIKAAQKADGGWGVSPTQSTPTEITDTLAALRALRKAGQADAFTVTRALNYIFQSQNTDAGWGVALGHSTELFYTAMALLVLKEYQDEFDLSPQLVPAAALLPGYQNADGSFGSPSGTAFETALALQAMLAYGNPQEPRSRALSYLASSQAPDGSWDDDPYSTALAVQAMYAALSIGLDDDQDQDGYSESEGDCNDFAPSVYPGASDLTVNGVDENCDGLDGPAPSDLDNDGDGYSAALGDCDDTNPGVSPGAVDDTFNGIDEDCDGFDGPDEQLDKDADGFTPQAGDCDDSNPAVYPGAPDKTINGIDEDCDGSDGPPENIDGDGDGYTPGQGDCDDGDPNVFPDAPDMTVNGIDENCDGFDGPRGQIDDDGDGFTPDQGDCDDANPAIHPGAVDILNNGIDEDCDGQSASNLVNITSVELFKEVDGSLIPTMSFGVYEIVLIHVTVDDPNVRLLTWVVGPTGDVVDCASSGENFSYYTYNQEPGTYTLQVYAEEPETRMVLDHEVVPFEIEPTVLIKGTALAVVPSISHLGATETIQLVLRMNNLSNVPVDLTAEYEVRTPSGAVVQNGASPFSVTPGPKVLGGIENILFESFPHTFTEKGDYPVDVRLLNGPDELGSFTGNVAVAPLIRIDPRIILTPDIVPPGEDRKIQIEIQLEGERR